jgi:predicted nucleic acid-binding protein
MAAVYWDTSALLKLYAAEADSADYLRLLGASTDDIAVSWLHSVELYYGLRGKEARGEIAVGAARILFVSWERHQAEGRYLRIPWGDDVALGAHRVLEAGLAASPPIPVRSLDGLHLGAALAVGISRIVSADLRMQSAATAVGLSVIIP